MSATRVRSAAEADLPAVRDIYNFYVRTSTCTFQLETDSEADRLAWFRARSPQHPVTVAEAVGEVVGWGSLSAWKDRAAYNRTVEASVYVRPDQHRRGVGRALLEDLVERARALGHRVVIGGACTEHPASIALQEAVGFVPVGCFRDVGYKFDRWLDVAYLQRVL
ncbi:MAG TPA: GNAT family N-acetyltransferase [Gemmataceae bacterium]|nr:GNAT family N-acetyltransferase [Gemmataceae bacterium]